MAQTRTRRRKGERLWLRYVVLAAWAAFCLAPILWFLSIGLRPRTEIIAPQPIYLPTFSLAAWEMIWRDWPMAHYLRNSLVAIAGSVLIDLALAIPAAYSLARYDYRGREDIGFYILSTRMMAPAIVAIPIFFLFRNLGLLDTVWALMLAYAAINLSLVTCGPGQDHDDAHDRRAGGADRRRDRHRRRGGQRRRSARPRRGDGVPELRALPQHERL